MAAIAECGRFRCVARRSPRFHAMDQPPPRLISAFPDLEPRAPQVQPDGFAPIVSNVDPQERVDFLLAHLGTRAEGLSAPEAARRLTQLSLIHISEPTRQA